MLFPKLSIKNINRLCYNLLPNQTSFIINGGNHASKHVVNYNESFTIYIVGTLYKLRGLTGLNVLGRGVGTAPRE